MTVAALRHNGIVIADDNPEFVELIGDVLSERGFNILAQEYDGNACIEKVQEFGDKVSVLILGLLMPGLTGFDVMQRLVEDHSSVIGIIMMTGTNTSQARSKFFELSSERVIASAFISKSEVQATWLGGEVERTIRRVEDARDRLG
jgi:CheY-like chemotaxis protein